MNIITPDADQFLIADAPYYAECGSEIAIFEAAWKQKVPICCSKVQQAVEKHDLCPTWRTNSIFL